MGWIFGNYLLLLSPLILPNPCPRVTSVGKLAGCHRPGISQNTETGTKRSVLPTGSSETESLQCASLSCLWGPIQN